MRECRRGISRVGTMNLATADRRFTECPNGLAGAGRSPQRGNRDIRG